MSSLLGLMCKNLDFSFKLLHFMDYRVNPEMFVCDSQDLQSFYTISSATSLLLWTRNSGWACGHAYEHCCQRCRSGCLRRLQHLTTSQNCTASGMSKKFIMHAPSLVLETAGSSTTKLLFGPEVLAADTTLITKDDPQHEEYNSGAVDDQLMKLEMLTWF